MEIIGVIVLIVILLTTVMQICFVWIYGRVLNSACQRVWATQKNLAQSSNGEIHAGQAESTDRSSNLLEEVAVVLCLRGADPSLAECLQGIIRQNRIPFQLHIVVDDERDPAIEMVERYLPVAVGSQELHLSLPSGISCQIHRLSQFPQKCSLKCAALLTAIDKIPAHIDKIAFLDADTIPDKNWLHDLLHPFSYATIPIGDFKSSTGVRSEISQSTLETFGWLPSGQSSVSIGATTGNRWFDPPTPSLGSYLRQVWNAAAVVQMALYNVAWGGSFAVNRETFHNASLGKRWANAFCEDTMLAGQLKKNGIRLFRVPELIVVNREATSIGDACRWIVRQLLTVRLYHRGWPLVALHGLSTGIVGMVAPLIAAVCWLSNLQLLAVVMITCWFLYQFLNAWLLRCITRWNQQLIAARSVFGNCRIDDKEIDEVDDRLDRHPPQMSSAPVIYFIAMLLAQCVQPLACIVAMFSRRVRWRGIEYKLGVGGDVELIHYRPMTEILNAEGTKESKIREPRRKSNSANPRSIT